MSDPCPQKPKPPRFAVLLTLLAASCGDRVPNAPAPVAKTAFATPTADASPHCADVGELRVCWVVPGAADGVTVVPRPVPVPHLSRLGYRCSGGGSARTCTDRALSAEEFVCDGPKCTQRHPRVPDDGEWECADIAGAVFCTGGGHAAGVPPGGPDTGFVCNARVVHGKKTAERICVDWSPDFPEGSSAAWRCRFSRDGGPARICERDAAAHPVGEVCDASHPCIDGLKCAASRCIPPRPEPSCWLDGDCGEGICRFGVCTARTE